MATMRRRPSWAPVAVVGGGLAVLGFLLWLLAAGHDNVRTQSNPARTVHSHRPARPRPTTKNKTSAAPWHATGPVVQPASPGANRNALNGVPAKWPRRARAASKDPDPAGLQANWRLDDGNGTVAADASGNGHAGTLEGHSGWSTDAPTLTGLKGSLQFDGEYDMVDIPNAASLNPTGSFSITAWCKTEGDADAYRAVISSRDSMTDGDTQVLRGYMIYATDKNTWQLMLGDGAAWNNTTGDVAIVNEWTHVAVTFEQTDADSDVLIGISRLFVDGELAATRTGARYMPQASGYPLRIGAGANAISTGNYHFSGKVADIRIYSRALSDDEVAAMCPWQ